jgi:hypothetical protein
MQNLPERIENLGLPQFFGYVNKRILYNLSINIL